MKKTFSLRVTASAISMSSVIGLPQAQAQVLEINPVVVSASRVEQPLSQVLSSVSVITRQDIEKSQAPTLADLLQGEAGFEFARNGGRGSTTSFFLRGQGSQSVLVMVDGVRVQTDQLASLTMTDMPLSQIERIEILRGNAGALYGESAIGGAINIQTRQGKGKPSAYGALSYGTRGSSDMYAGYGGQFEDLKFDLNAGQSGTKGFSAINPIYYPTIVNPDNDSYKSQFATGKLEKKVNADTLLGIRFSVKKSKTDYDNPYGPSDGDDGTPSQINQFKVNTNSTGIFGKMVVTENWISHLDFSNSNYKYEDTKNGSLVTTTYDSSLGRYYGEQNTLRWLNNYQIQKDTKATIGADLNRETFGQSSSYDLIRNTDGYFGGISHKQQRWDLQGNLRTDKVKVTNIDSSGTISNNSTNTNSTLIGVGYQLDAMWRIVATQSTGFRAPNAYEISLNSSLVAETHKSNETGISYSDESTLVRATYFASNTKNAITYANSTYTNIGEVQNKGIELTARTLLLGNSVKLNYVSQDPWNATSNSILVRRARQYGSLDLSRTIQSYTFGSKVITSGQRYDSGWLGGYSVWSFYASQAINNELTARLRLENAFDHKYELVRSYNTPGRGIYATLQYQPK